MGVFGVMNEQIEYYAEEIARLQDTIAEQHRQIQKLLKLVEAVNVKWCNKGLPPPKQIAEAMQLIYGHAPRSEAGDD